MKPKLKPPGTKRLKLKHDHPPSSFAFKCNLRRYIKVQGLAYRTSPGEYFMSNLFFGTVTASGSAGRAAGERVAFSYHTDNDKALKEVNAVDHGSPTLNATMMFRPKEGDVCEAHGVIGTGKISLLLGDADACKVGRCRLTVSKPVLKAPMVSALETPI